MPANAGTLMSWHLSSNRILPASLSTILRSSSTAIICHPFISPAPPLPPSPFSPSHRLRNPHHSFVLPKTFTYSPFSPILFFCLLCRKDVHSFQFLVILLRIDFAPHSFSPYDIRSSRTPQLIFAISNLPKLLNEKKKKKKNKKQETGNISAKLLSRSIGELVRFNPKSESCQASSNMFNKLVVLLAAALAVTAQAGHVKHHHVRRHYGSVPQNSTSVAPQSTPSASPVPISSGTAPVGSGSSASPSLLSSSTSLSASLLPSSSNPPSRSPSTAPSASLFPSSSIPLGTAPGVPPFPVSSGSLSASQNPSSTVPLGTGVTGAPAKVSLVTSDSVLTYTIGTGSSTTVIVTTVKHTRTSTIVKVSVQPEESSIITTLR